MKKIILLALVLGFATVNAQDADNQSNDTQTDTNEVEKKRKYRTWAIGLDLGFTSTLMDLYSLEAGGGNSVWGDVNSNVKWGASFRLEKWISTYLGFAGELGLGHMNGSKRIYAFQSDYYRANLKVNFNLLGVGAFNRVKHKEQKHALIFSTGIGQLWNKPEMYVYDPNAGMSEPELLYILTGDGQAQFLDDATNESWTNNPGMLFGLEWRWRFARNWDLRISHQTTAFWHDNVDGSWTLEQEENLDRFYFARKNNDYMGFTSAGVDWYIGGKKTEDRDVIIYTNPFTEIQEQVDDNTDKIGMIMTDEDNDGVSDVFDKDTETPEGHVVDGSGVSRDADRDGIPDSDDDDPFSTIGAQVDENGVELDDDKDGVPNTYDLEPGTPEKALVDVKGREIKGDNNDAVFLPAVYFDFNKSFVTTANYRRMAVVKRYMDNNPDAKLHVVGHTDPVGTEAYNQNLGERRAKAVVKILVNDFDMDESRLILSSKGESELISKRNDINRRVVFIPAE